MNALLGPTPALTSDTTTCGGRSQACQRLNDTDECPKTIIYSLNPADNEQIGTILGCFQSSEVPGKIQHGSAWWFNDQKIGMENQMKSLANLGLLGKIRGRAHRQPQLPELAHPPTTSAASCATRSASGRGWRVPNDEKALEKIVKGICFDNAKRYFAL